MRLYDLPALSIAIAKHERLKFAAGFGYVDLRKREPATPLSLFRVRLPYLRFIITHRSIGQVGSVSKPITAAAVMTLVERGLVVLDAPLFGEGRVFGEREKERMREIR